jgi:cellulose synthase/poly-beta-1,6-N-acetylglucosamine synthase-like glycosyltransferase
MIICFVLYKTYGKRRSYQCRKCYNSSRELNKKGYCKSCQRDFIVNKITNKISFNFLINSKILIILYWVLLGLSILLSLIIIVFSIKSLLIYSSFSLLLGTVTYFYYTFQDLKIKK